MPFADSFATDDGDLSYPALIQQCAFCSLIYYNAQQQFQLVANQYGGATLRGGAFQPDKVKPSWAVFTQGLNVFLVFAGTTNATQWASHALAPANEYAEDPDRQTFVHPQWQRIWALLIPDIDPLIQQYMTLNSTLFISGHSYGGAITNLAGFTYARVYGELSVETMTFGSPFVISKDSPIPKPSVMFRVVNKNDLIATIGPVLPTTLVPGLKFLPGKAAAKYLYPFEHHGKCYRMDPPAIRFDPVPDKIGDSIIGIGSVTENHPMQNYMMNVTLTAGKLLSVSHADAFTARVALYVVSNSRAPADLLPIPYVDADYVAAANRIYYPFSPTQLTEDNINHQSSIGMTVDSVDVVEALPPSPAPAVAAAGNVTSVPASSGSGASYPPMADRDP